jgi:DNA-binding SARP family transcriptional activator
MSILRINLFGGIEVLTTTGEPVLIASRKASTLFGFLTLICPHGASRGKLSSLFWDGQHEDHARASLRQTLLALRRALSHHPAVFVAIAKTFESAQTWLKLTFRNSSNSWWMSTQLG